MTKTIFIGLLWFSAIGCGVLAGVYFAFSSFIMKSLGHVEKSTGLAVMKSINVDIYASTFMPLFWATTIAAAVLAVMALYQLGAPGSHSIMAGGIIYVIGMFVVTVAFNIHLNNSLVALISFCSEADQVWSHYLRNWTFWNHVRALASLASCALFISAIAVI